MPSAVRRLRSQLRQNGSVVDEMMPNDRAVGQREAIGRRRRVLDDRLDGPVARGEPLEHLARATRRRSGDQRVAPPTSMYSMNRTSAFIVAAVLDQIDQLVVVDAANDDACRS